MESEKYGPVEKYLFIKHGPIGEKSDIKSGPSSFLDVRLFYQIPIGDNQKCLQ